MVPQVSQILGEAQEQLERANLETSRLDAELLLAHLLGIERLGLLSFSDPISADVKRDLKSFIERRAKNEPVAYITGLQGFWNHDFIVNQHTLIPRQDTETLVELALKENIKKADVLDLGTGTGCIALSILDERPEWSATAVDVSGDALKVARQNAEGIGVSDRITFLESDWFSALDAATGQFDIIVANPPYIASADMAALMPDVKDYEPVQALDGGADGLDPYRLISETAPSFLKSGGLLAVEVGVFQSNDTFDIFEGVGFLDVQIHKDLPGHERVVSGRKI